MINDGSIVERFDNYLKKNTVNDFICNTTRIVIVCESPHTDELEKGLPLVGRTGKSVSKHLGINKNIGLGEYLDSQEFPVIGIMNVCTAPLQKTASRKQSDFDFNKTDFIRKNYDRLFCHRDPDINEMEKIIVNDFKMRLNQLARNNDLTKIVICGNYAMRYFCEVSQNIVQLPVALMPHPARNKWSRLTNEQKCILDELKNAI